MFSRKFGPLVGALLMFVFSGSWILVTDAFVDWVVPATRLSFAHSVKGIFYVSLASALVYWLLCRSRRQSAELLKHRLSLQEADLLKTSSLLALGVSHDIRNIAAVFSLNLNVLLEKTPKHCAECHEVVGDLMTSTKRLTALTKQLSLRREDSLQHFSPRTVIQDHIAFLNRSKVLRNPATVQFVVDTPDMYGSVSRLEQMLTNLVLNGDQATECNRPVAVVVSTTSEGIRIIVRDHGKGIAPGTLAQIWEPLYTTKKNGSGMGMSVVKEAVGCFHGKIDVVSAPGEGTVFTILLPVVQSATIAA